MKTIGTIIAQPVSSYQLEAMKAFMLALDIKFELQIANENSGYNKEFVDRVLQGDEDIKAGKGKRIGVQE
jgi:hypothetical protein